MTGWIKIHRKLLDWEWKTDPNVVALFIHLLLKANHKQTKWRGQTIQRGQLPIGRKQLAIDTGLSEQQVRTALHKLEKSNIITSKPTNKFTTLTIVKYDEYQSQDYEATNNTTNKQPTNNQQITTPKECKNEKNEKKKENINKKSLKRPDDISENVWNDFLQHRKELKSPVTELAITRIRNEAIKANWNLEDALAEICARGWKGFNHDWVEKKKTGFLKDIREVGEL